MFSEASLVVYFHRGLIWRALALISTRYDNIVDVTEYSDISRQSPAGQETGAVRRPVKLSAFKV